MVSIGQTGKQRHREVGSGGRQRSFHTALDVMPVSISFSQNPRKESIAFNFYKGGKTEVFLFPQAP